MKKIISLVTLAVFMLAMPFAVAEETIDPVQLMEDVAGTYVPLFSVLNKPEYDDVWLSHSAEIDGEEIPTTTREFNILYHGRDLRPGSRGSLCRRSGEHAL